MFHLILFNVFMPKHKTFCFNASIQADVVFCCSRSEKHLPSSRSDAV